MKFTKKLSFLLTLIACFSIVLGLFSTTVIAEKEDSETEVEENVEEDVEESAETDEEAMANAIYGSKVVAIINGEREVTLQEMNFFAGLILQQMTQTPAFDTGSQSILETVIPSENGEEKTMLQTIINILKEELPLKDAVLKEAADFELDEEQKGIADSFLMSIQQSAMQNKLPVEALLERFYGPDSNMESIRGFIEKDIRHSAYLQELYNNREISKEDIELEYEKNAQLYDIAEFVLSEIPADADEEMLSELEKTVEEAEDEKDFIDGLFSVLAVENAEIENFSQRIKVKAKFAEIPNPEVAEWIFDTVREADDKEILDTEEGKFAVYYLNRERDEARNYDSRHILIKEAGNSELDKKVAKAKAEVILAELEDGEISEEIFAEIATKHSDDPGSQAEGGLYEDIEPGQFVPEYEGYVLDPEREEGDIGMVYVEGGNYSGYHIIYFKGLRDTNWERAAEINLRTEAQKAYLEEIGKDCSFEFVDNGEELVLALPEFEELELEKVEKEDSEEAEEVEESPEEDSEEAPEEGEADEEAEETVEDAEDAETDENPEAEESSEEEVEETEGK